MKSETLGQKGKVAILKQLPVFGSCTPSQLLLIAERTRLVEYKKGEYVYSRGDTADALYIVSSGRFRVSLDPGSESRTLIVLHDADLFGEISLLTGEKHSATVQALNDAIVLRLSKRDFEEVINRIPSLVLYLSRLLSKRLRTRTEESEYSEATIASVYSATRGLESSLFAIVLATILTRDSRQPTVIVDVHGVAESRKELYGTQGHCRINLPGIPGLIPEEELNAAAWDHPLGFTVLSIGEILKKHGGEQAVAPIVSTLTKYYRYVLLDLGEKFEGSVLKALVQSDVIYLLADQHQDTIARAKSLLNQVHQAIGFLEQRVKVVIKTMHGIGLPVSFNEIGDELGATATFGLPDVPSPGNKATAQELSLLIKNHTSPFVVAIRRIARDLSGSVVGIAFGSGAALGLAHIGVLKVLEREKIPVDIVAGSSIGALISALWASGRSASELEKMALKFSNLWDIRRLFMFDIGIPVTSIIIGVLSGFVVGSLIGFWAGLLFGVFACVILGIISGLLAGGPIAGKQLLAKLRRDFSDKTFEDTWLPVKVVASNPMERKEVIFESGSLAEAVRASVSIPGIFKPVIKGKTVCLDGGVVNPVPVNVLKKYGAHRIIAINVFPTDEDIATYWKTLRMRQEEHEAKISNKGFLVRLWWWLREEIMRSNSPLVFDIIVRSMQSMEYQIGEVACHDADVVLRPTVSGSYWLEFYDAGKFIKRGEEVAMEHLDEIKSLTQVSPGSLTSQ